MICLQLTANTGPAECCLALAKAIVVLQREADLAGVTVQELERQDGPIPGTVRSVLLALADGKGEAGAALLARRWSGSILWVCDSPYRKLHRRKNWFLGGQAFVPQALTPDSRVIRYEATRASGPGGQHVNKTDSAIRATHVASGLSVKVQSERSQHANKRLAAQLLASKLAEQERARTEQGKAERRTQHSSTERGNAARVFVGPDFVERV